MKMDPVPFNRMADHTLFLPRFASKAIILAGYMNELKIILIDDFTRRATSPPSPPILTEEYRKSKEMLLISSNRTMA